MFENTLKTFPHTCSYIVPVRLVEPIELMPRAQGRGLGAEEKLVKISGSKRKPGDEPPKVSSSYVLCFVAFSKLSVSAYFCR